MFAYTIYANCACYYSLLVLLSPYLLSVIPVKTGIQEGMDPQSEALRFRLRMTRGGSFPHPFCHSRENGNPVVLSESRIKCGMTKRNVDPQSEALRFRLRMTRGLSVKDDKGCVIPVKTGIQSEWIPNPKRFAFG